MGRKLTYGHVELNIGEHLWCLRGFPNSDPLTPEGTSEALAVYEGCVPKRPLKQVTDEINGLREERRRADPGFEQPPAEADVFDKELGKTDLAYLQAFLEKQSTNAPKYCATSVEGAMNCVTFAAWTLKETGVLPMSFNLGRVNNRRPYLPDTFYAAMLELYNNGVLDSNWNRVLVGSKWIQREPGRASSTQGGA
jgi:hypothetical protein